MKNFLLLILYFLAFQSIATVPEKKISNPDGIYHPDFSIDTALINDSTRVWFMGANGHFNLNQVSFTNWAEGGESTLAGNTFGVFKATYLKKKFKADNYLLMAYGITWSDEQGIRKTDDKIEIGTAVGYEVFENWYYSLVSNLKSQFSDGYKYPDDSTLVSTFLAPANFLLSLGMEYKPNKYTSVFISPASGKFIFVANQELADKGAFGVTPAVRDSLGNVLIPGSDYKAKFGFNFILNYHKDILKNVNLSSKLNLHNNYMDENIDNRWNVDVDWETAFNFRINSFLSSMIYMHFLYDHDIKIPQYEHIDGIKTQVGAGPRLQMKQNFGIGVSIKV
jgi:hypothetical protein